MHATMTPRRQQGAGLLSVILALFVMGIMVLSFSTFIQPLATQPVQILEHRKALNIAKSLMQEISFKRFDEQLNTPNKPRCSATKIDQDSQNASMLCSEKLGPEESRPFYNDVDDYHGFNETMTLLHSKQTYADAYPNYKVQVNVSYLRQNGSRSDSRTHTKIIEVFVTTPRGKKVKLQSLKGNY
jgi:MSHA pilin protein MshD